MKTVRRDLRESSVSDRPHQVDRTAGVIRRVKVLGSSSPNRHGLQVTGTEYTREAMEAALPQYDGRQVYVDHPPRSKPDMERSMRDLVGELKNPTLESDGVYADLHYLPETEDGRRLADIAERMPKRLGLSHNASGSGKIKSGKYVIESIDGVRSVDLTTRPATTKGLYESQEQTMAKTLKEALGELKLDATVAAKLSKRLLEMDGMDDAAPMPAAPSDVGGDESAETHLGRSILAIVNDTSLDMAAKRKKIMAILKLMDDEAPADGGDTTPADTGADDEPTMESIQTELKSLKTKDAVRSLCESEKFTPTAIQLKSLTLLESEADRKALIGELKAAKPAGGGPRSQGSGRQLTESADKPKDSAGWLKKLKSPAIRN